jgi:hypothetical protein
MRLWLYPLSSKRHCDFILLREQLGKSGIIIALYNELGSYVISTDNYTVTGRDSLHKFIITELPMIINITIVLIIFEVLKLY